MKRYDFDRAHCTGSSEFGCPSSMEESSIGDYVRWEDLIAAGCLVRVPDGEARKIKPGLTIIHKGKVCYTDTRWDDYFPFDVREKDTHKWMGKLGQSTIVQPVRLVRLEDVE